MPIRCVERPNRNGPRYFTADKAIAIACNAIRHGATRAEIEAGIAQCGIGDRRPKSSDALEALAVAVTALEASNAVFDADAQALQRFLIPSLIAGIAQRLIARIPVIGPALAVTLTITREMATERLKQVAVQKAANDAALAVVRRAAANEAQFLRTGTGL